MNLGKVELHLHLDGSLDLETAYRLAMERNVIDEKNLGLTPTGGDPVNDATR